MQCYIEDEMVLIYVHGIRACQPRMGTRKLYYLREETQNALEQLLVKL